MAATSLGEKAIRFQPTISSGGERRRRQPPLTGSALVNEVVRPALAEIERTFSAALDRIVISDMIKLPEAPK
jgi:hypothetical protein